MDDEVSCCRADDQTIDASISADGGEFPEDFFRNRDIGASGEVDHLQPPANSALISSVRGSSSSSRSARMRSLGTV